MSYDILRISGLPNMYGALYLLVIFDLILGVQRLGTLSCYVLGCNSVVMGSYAYIVRHFFSSFTFAYPSVGSEYSATAMRRKNGAN